MGLHSHSSGGTAYCFNMKDLARICAVLVILTAVAVQDAEEAEPICVKKWTWGLSDQCSNTCCIRDLEKENGGRCPQVSISESKKKVKEACKNKVKGKVTVERRNYRMKAVSLYTCTLCQNKECTKSCANDKYTCFNCDFDNGCQKVDCTDKNCGSNWDRCKVDFH